jgi:hypothetical protein
MNGEAGGALRLFAGIVLMVAGVMRLFDAIWAFRYNGSLTGGLQKALLGSTLSTYGWLWLIVAIVVFLSGLIIVSQAMMKKTVGQAARWIGVATGAIIAITAIWWIPYFPVWSLVYIGIGVLVIYALVAFGQRQPA